MRDGVVDRNTRWERNALQNYLLIKRKFGTQNPAFQCTFRHPDSFDGFVVNCTSALLDELITLDAEIDNFCSLHAELNELFRDLMDDVRSGLQDNWIFFNGGWIPDRFAYLILGEVGLEGRHSRFLGVGHRVCSCSGRFK